MYLFKPPVAQAAVRSKAAVLLIYFFVAPIVCWGFVFNLCFVIQYFVSILFCNNLNGEERAGCFTLTVFICLVTVSVLWLFLTVPWAGLQCAIVVFPDHTHLPFLVVLIFTVSASF